MPNFYQEICYGCGKRQVDIIWCYGRAIGTVTYQSINEIAWCEEGSSNAKVDDLRAMDEFEQLKKLRVALTVRNINNPSRKDRYDGFLKKVWTVGEEFGNTKRGSLYIYINPNTGLLDIKRGFKIDA